MAMVTKRAPISASPSYCPCCQRLYRKTPASYMCPADNTPLIDVSDPLPVSWSQGLYVGLGAAVVAVVSLGVTIV